MNDKIYCFSGKSLTSKILLLPRNNRVTKLDNFNLGVYENLKEINIDNFSFSPASEYFYKEILTEYKKISIKEKLSNKIFLERVYACLVAWRLNRGSNRLVSFERFKNILISQESNLKKLENWKLEDINSKLDEDSEVGEILLNFFKEIRIVETIKNKKDKLNKEYTNSASVFVSISKLLHFLLPNLVIPMDNAYTGQIVDFQGNWQRQFASFLKIMESARMILRCKRVIIDNFYKDPKYKDYHYYTKPKLIDEIIIDYVNNRDRYDVKSD